jgi:hypothetical protein
MFYLIYFFAREYLLKIYYFLKVFYPSKNVSEDLEPKITG